MNVFRNMFFENVIKLGEGDEFPSILRKRGKFGHTDTHTETVKQSQRQKLAVSIYKEKNSKD